MRIGSFAAILLVNCVAMDAVASTPTPAPTATRGDVPLLARSGAGTVPRWPVELSALAVSVQEVQQLDLVLNRAAEWMATFPADQLRFDAAMMLASIRETIDSEALRTAFERARAVADRDDDNPGRRLWVSDLKIAPQHTSGWTVPTAAGQRVNTNRVVGEALFCKENGWRSATTRYACGTMRDDGGYHTTHALWALAIAHRNGCIATSEFEPCVRSIQAELVAAQPSSLVPQATLDIDLFAERLLTLILTGYQDTSLNQWAQNLMRLQGPDGSWGVLHDGEPHSGEQLYYRYHTTAVTTWALAEWYRRQVGHPGTVAP